MFKQFSRIIAILESNFYSSLICCNLFFWSWKRFCSLYDQSGCFLSKRDSFWFILQRGSCGSTSAVFWFFSAKCLTFEENRMCRNLWMSGGIFALSVVGSKGIRALGSISLVKFRPRTYSLTLSLTQATANPFFSMRA